MSAPVTREEFLDLVRRSEVLEGERLESFAQSLSDSGTALDQPKIVAERMIKDGLLTVFQAKQILAGKWRRFRLSGKYKLLETIGAGGMGAVYLCKHIFMDRFVALKILPTDKLQDPSSLERFYREARAAGALDHPNIVRAYDIDQDDKTHFLVMEYVDGASLQEIVGKHGKMDPIRAANYIRQAALGLQHAHEAGLVHRDIKPGNLLVDRNGTVKVLDLGLARFFDARKDNVTERYDDGAVLGTADYLAPEQAMHNKVDIRADIYSLGATFFFMLTGRAPFEDGTLTQKLLWHQIRKIQSVADYRGDVPPEMAAVIEKMLTKSPEDRYETPQQVADALAPWAQQPISPPPAAWFPKRSLAALTVGAQGDAPVLPATPTPRSSVVRGPGSSRNANSTPAPKTILPTSAVPKLTAPRESRNGEFRRPRRRPAPSNERTKMIAMIAGGSVASLALIFTIVWAASRKPESKPQNLPIGGVTSTPPPTVAPRSGSTRVATPITADQAKDHLGEFCLVEMTVKRIGHSQTRYFLNHMEEYKDPRCFTVTFEKPVFDQLAARGINVDSLTNKVIRVRGTVTKFKNPRDGVVSVQIDVDDASQITTQ
jgi:serine/threonine protein kinase